MDIVDPSGDLMTKRVWYNIFKTIISHILAGKLHFTDISKTVNVTHHFEFPDPGRIQSKANQGRDKDPMTLAPLSRVTDVILCWFPHSMREN